jgi:hypothetical protein
MLKHSILATAVAICMPLAVKAETFLYMAEEHGCMWCQRWTEEIGPIYPKTTEGKTAPLVRFDAHGSQPEGVTFARRVHYTPTFVLVEDGQEVGRIEGYPGEDFFWGLLGMMFDQARIPLMETEVDGS